MSPRWVWLLSVAGYEFSALLAGLRVADSKPGELRPVSHAELRVSARQVRLHRVAGDEQLPGDVGIAQALAGQLDHSPLDRAQAGPSMRGVRVRPPPPLSVSYGLRERKPRAILQRPFKTLIAQCSAGRVAQCSAGRGQVPLRSLPQHRKSHEAKRGPLLLGSSDEPDGAPMLTREHSDLSDHIERVDNPRTPPAL